MEGALGAAENILYTATTVLVTIFVGVIIAKLAGRIAKRVLAEAEINRLLKDSGFKAADQRIATIVEIIIYAITGLLILQELGLTHIALGIVIITAATAIAIFLFLTLRTFIPNSIQGLSIKKELHRKLGKEIQIGTIHGKLIKIGPVHSIVLDKEKHYIPHIYTAKNLKRLPAN